MIFTVTVKGLTCMHTNLFAELIGTPMGAGAPNRPLPPTPDEDANERTLIMKRVRA